MYLSYDARRGTVCLPPLNPVMDASQPHRLQSSARGSRIRVARQQLWGTFNSLGFKVGVEIGVVLPMGKLPERHWTPGPARWNVEGVRALLAQAW